MPASIVIIRLLTTPWRRPPLWRELAQAAACACVLLAVAPLCADDLKQTPLQARQELDEQFLQDLEKLAARCRELGMAQEAAVTSAWFLPSPVDRRRLYLPQESETPAVAAPPSAGPGEFWRRKFMSLRADYAQKLVALAHRAVTEGDLARGYQWLHEALREDPDQPVARQVLDYRVVNGRWRRAGAPTRVETVRVRHPQFGFAPGRYWRIESANFRITTDHSPEAGEKLCGVLEMFHDVWRQLFVEYWTTPESVAARFERAASSSRSRKRFRVTLFRDREAYITHLKPRQPLIEKTVGIYFDDLQESFLYSSDDASLATWYHEITHQLFQEAISRPRGAGDKANFWAIEGAALYMESLRMHSAGERATESNTAESAALENTVTLGGYDAERLQFARHRVKCEGFYVPLGDFVRLGKDAMQQDANLPKLYSQAAGLAHFLIDGEQGRHRARFANYLQAIYEQRDRPDAMAGIWGDQFGQLDAGYARFLDVSDDDLARSPPPAFVRNLALGRTGVTDRGVEYLKHCRSLDWLDLSHTEVGDAGLAPLAGLSSLTHLGLEGARVTDAGLPSLAGLSRLEELDLSSTAIGDDGLLQVARLAGLKSLWLTETQVTGAGLSHLAALKDLEELHVERTAVDATAVQRLRQLLPRLQVFQ